MVLPTPSLSVPTSVLDLRHHCAIWTGRTGSAWRECVLDDLLPATRSLRRNTLDLVGERIYRFELCRVSSFPMERRFANSQTGIEVITTLPNSKSEVEDHCGCTSTGRRYADLGARREGFGTNGAHTEALKGSMVW